MYIREENAELHSIKEFPEIKDLPSDIQKIKTNSIGNFMFKFHHKLVCLHYKYNQKRYAMLHNYTTNIRTEHVKLL